MALRGSSMPPEADPEYSHFHSRLSSRPFTVPFHTSTMYRPRPFSPPGDQPPDSIATQRSELAGPLSPWRFCPEMELINTGPIGGALGLRLKSVLPKRSASSEHGCGNIQRKPGRDFAVAVVPPAMSHNTSRAK